MSISPIPPGYHTVTPYLIAERALELLDFLKQAFEAVEKHRMVLPDGRLMHAELKIGDSPVMLGEAGPQWPSMPASLHLYVEDCDAWYRRALAAGAQSLIEPTDQFYGDRMSGVRDPSGNCWWLATRIEDVSAEELKRRQDEIIEKQQAG